MFDISYFENFCTDNSLNINLSFCMPKGYEDAFGSFDVTENTLYINKQMLSSTPEYQALYYLYHELRHAMQYTYPERFSEEIQKSRFYSILYNGTCYKLVDNQWKTCQLQGAEEYFIKAYLNMPIETDANTFAYEQTKAVMGDSPELKSLYNWWMPKENFSYDEYLKLYREIDNNIKL